MPDDYYDPLTCFEASNGDYWWKMERVGGWGEGWEALLTPTSCIFSLPPEIKIRVRINISKWEGLIDLRPATGHQLGLDRKSLRPENIL